MMYPSPTLAAASRHLSPSFIARVLFFAISLLQKNVMPPPTSAVAPTKETKWAEEEAKWSCAAADDDDTSNDWRRRRIGRRHSSSLGHQSRIFFVLAALLSSSSLLVSQKSSMSTTRAQSRESCSADYSFNSFEESRRPKSRLSSLFLPIKSIFSLSCRKHVFEGSSLFSLKGIPCRRPDSV